MSQTYFKATRPDGTSFRDSATAWRVGETTTLGRDDVGRGLCSPDVLHASAEPAMTLIGGQWPCRLFEVEARGAMTKAVNHKIGATAWLVVRELPAWQALGPNGEAAASIIQRASRLTYDEAMRLAAAWDAARAAAWDAAWDAARAAARAAAGAAARDAAWDAARAAARDAAWDAARDAARAAAGAAARDAAGAAAGTLVRDLITDEQYQLLAGPWLLVIGEP
jgi:hypothetical protein